MTRHGLRPRHAADTLAVTRAAMLASEWRTSSPDATSHISGLNTFTCVMADHSPFPELCIPRYLDTHQVPFWSGGYPLTRLDCPADSQQLTLAHSPYRLLVEGRDDEHCVLQLMRRHGVNWDDPKAAIAPRTWLQWLRSVAGAARFVRQVIWTPRHHGRCQRRHPSSGQLEDFLGTLIPANDGCGPYAREVTRRAKELGARFPEKMLCRANVHTWLAWQETPGLPFGMAITAKYFGVDSTEARAFFDWFKRIFF